MRKIYIRKGLYRNLLDHNPSKPRARFMKYYNDLSSLENTSYQIMKKTQLKRAYSYAELGDVILEQLGKSIELNQVDLFVACYWSHEFDPDFSYGAYFCEKYKIKGRMFDICDQGILSPIMALKIIQCYVNSGLIKNALLLSFDQIAFPVASDFSNKMPNKASSIGLCIESEYSLDCYLEIEESDFYGEHVNNKVVNRNNVNCDEILTPLLKEKQCHKNNPHYTLNVKDIESNIMGYIKGRFLGGGNE